MGNYLNCIIIIILIIAIYEFCIKETMISYKISNKEFKVYDKFENYDVAGKMLYQIDDNIKKLLNHLETKYIKYHGYGIDNVLRQRLIKLINTYRAEHIKENFPSTIINGRKPDSSFTLNKKKISLCLRDDKTKKFHNINDIMFVCIHELAHIVNPTFGHPKSFWIYMKFLLHEAQLIGIYEPEDYSKNNKKYCNTHLRANPYFYGIDCDGGIPHVCHNFI